MNVDNNEYFKSKVELFLNAYRGDNTPLINYRRNKLQDIYDYFNEKGFPKALTNEELSLIPSHFQEAIYDGINWDEQNSNLGHLEVYFQIDCIFQNEGKMRNELSQQEFKTYADYSWRIVDQFKNKNHR